MHYLQQTSNTPASVAIRFMQTQNVSRATMTSRDISDLVKSRHDKVKQSIERLVERGVIVQPPVGDEQFNDSLGRPRTEAVYRICKRDSFVVVAQLSPEFTAALVDRWAELEAQQSATLPDFSNPAAAARAWAEQFELQQQASQALIEAAPKIQFVDRYVESTGLKGFRQTAKLLKANESRFREFMLDKKIMYRMGGEWQAYQPHIDAGRFEVKAGTSESGHAYNQSKFTPKGVNWVAGLWAQYNLEGEL